jgi:hypothetical protein
MSIPRDASDEHRVSKQKILQLVLDGMLKAVGIDKLWIPILELPQLRLFIIVVRT